MRKLFFVLLFVPLMLQVQNTEFGYLGLKEVMNALPEARVAQEEYDALVALCDQEIEHSEETLTRAYVSFLDGQQSFPEPILRKRQKELQEMVDRIVVLRDELKEYLVQAHDSLFSPIVQKIDTAIESVCLRNNLAYAIDTDKEVYRFVNHNFGVNITDLVIQEVISPKQVEKTREFVSVEEGAESEAADAASTTEKATSEAVDTTSIAEENTTSEEIQIVEE
jgi:outer membrane protein